MDRLINIILRRWLVVTLIVLSAMSASLGIAQQGADIWSYGPPGWMLQIFGFLLFLCIVSYMVLEWDEKLRTLPWDEVAEAAKPVDREAERRAQEERSASLQISNAIDHTNFGDYAPDDVDALEALAILKSTFATIRKLYQIDSPILERPNLRSLRIGREFLRQVQPFLDANHISEARAAAEAYMRGEPA